MDVFAVFSSAFADVRSSDRKVSWISKLRFSMVRAKLIFKVVQCLKDGEDGVVGIGGYCLDM